ncbi:MAG: hypothetical protein ACXVZI_10160, partial [Terriglobales bacterium]
IGFITRYRTPVLYVLLVLAALGGMGALVYFKYYRPKRRAEEKRRGEPVEDLPIPGKGNQKLKEQQQGRASDADSVDEDAKEKTA